MLPPQGVILVGLGDPLVLNFGSFLAALLPDFELACGAQPHRCERRLVPVLLRSRRCDFTVAVKALFTTFLRSRAGLQGRFYARDAITFLPRGERHCS
uniref:Uncharacterized protein n=1 Tax=Mycena chlorophos TaxID=658473 RepID=A0ABQ0KX00_MYCCL|nr:predicted protein [Mycena chlorophos]